MDSAVTKSWNGEAEAALKPELSNYAVQYDSAKIPCRFDLPARFCVAGNLPWKNPVCGLAYRIFVKKTL